MYVIISNHKIKKSFNKEVYIMKRNTKEEEEYYLKNIINSCGEI